MNSRQEGQSTGINHRGLISGPWIWTEILGEFIRFLSKLFVIRRGLFHACDIWPDLGILRVDDQPFRIWLILNFWLDGLHWTLRFAGGTVNAFIWMNDEHVFSFIEAVDRTHFNTIHVFASNTGIHHDKGHGYV